jgi:DNA relaxase NicK
MWEVWFKEFLGTLEPVGHGGRGFQKLYRALLETKLYTEPLHQQDVVDNQYFSFEFPGSACDALPDKVIQEFILVLDRWEKARITRLDLAWDGVSFSPEQVKEAVERKELRSHLRKESMKYTISPYEPREDGQIGTTSLRLGSNSSNRLLRVYDKHGPVRLELQNRKERADLIARDVLKRTPQEWFAPAIGHLRDYVDFVEPGSESLLYWWEIFIDGANRAMKTVSDARTVELNRIVTWVNQQVSPALSVLADVIGKESIDAFIIDGRRKRSRKYNALLSKNKEEHKNKSGGQNEHSN